MDGETLELSAETT